MYMRGPTAPLKPSHAAHFPCETFSVLTPITLLIVPYSTCHLELFPFLHLGKFQTHLEDQCNAHHLHNCASLWSCEAPSQSWACTGRYLLIETNFLPPLHRHDADGQLWKQLLAATGMQLETTILSEVILKDKDKSM